MWQQAYNFIHLDNGYNYYGRIHLFFGNKPRLSGGTYAFKSDVIVFVWPITLTNQENEWNETCYTMAV